MTKREETNDILQFLIPQLEELGIKKEYIKQDATLKETGQHRGDIWISTEKQNSRKFESSIVALIEAKHRKCVINDVDWLDAKKQGRKKSKNKKLPYYIVTNCKDLVRFYNVANDEEITLDGEVITRLQPIDVLQKIVAQVKPGNSNVLHESITKPNFTEVDFHKKLWQLKTIYRNSKLDSDQEMINTTIGFIALKFISEKEGKKRTLPENIELWEQYRPTQMHRDIKHSIEDITKTGKYKDFKGTLFISDKLDAEQCAKIHKELSSLEFYGCNFDVYGAVYEYFADKKTKKDLGQYYTRRHISRAMAETLLRNELKPRPLKICDPACGTGGILTECFNVLKANYESSNTLDERVMERLSNETFYGFDIKERNIALAKLNMFFAGDGHTNIKLTEDSLIHLETDYYDYIITNIPMGTYAGNAKPEDFDFSNSRRYDVLFTEKIIKALKYGVGEAAIIVPDGLLETPNLEKFRIKMLQHVDIKAIVSLHQYVFRPYSSEKTYVIYFQRKQKKNVGKIQKSPIWVYILENDGFQKGDKRYKINEDDIPDWVSNFMTTKTKGQSKFVDIEDINADNFYNLLPEYHLPQGEDKHTEVPIHDFKKVLQELSSIEEVLEGIWK